MGGQPQVRDGQARGRTGRRTWLTVAIALSLVFAVFVAGAALVVTGVLEVSWSGRTAADSATPTASPTRPKATPAPSSPAARALAGPVLPPAGVTPALPTAAGLAAALAGAVGSPTLGPHVSVAVRDATTGKLLYGKDGAGAYIPASTTKILTGTAVLAVLGPEHRFETKVVEGARPGQIVLVGGGDPMLSTAAAVARRTGKTRSYPKPATIDDLAARTARALRASGTTSVQVLFDDSLFAELASATWESQYVPTGVVARISALWVDEAKLSWPSRLPRASDPGMAATEAFVQGLARGGVAVTGTPVRTKAAASARKVAAVASPPLGRLVEHVLLISDNDGAEVLARHVAVAEGKPATFEASARAIREVLARLGVKDAAQIRLHDGSGLSRAGRLSADVLTQTLAVAARPEFPDLRPVLTGLPVAGFDGSLESRFYDDRSDPGVGVVRAKTGTLSGVSSLAGIATTKDGAVLTFALMTDRVRQTDPRPSLDQAASVLARCGCR